MKNEVDYSKMSASEAIEAKARITRETFEKKEAQLSQNGVLVTLQRKAILDLQFCDLLERLRDGRLKALETLQAFQAKALEEHKKTNCLCEFVPQAEQWARERDSTPAGKKGSLHGLPLSVKENFDIRGMDTTLGLTKRLGKPLQDDAVLVSVLMEQGAVPFVKTNVPQIIYSMGCSNPIYGETTNPHDTTRSPGGSSGGEAALIAGGGSVLGIGTDMCGSIRTPATFCGIYGIKPGQKRISREGSHGAFKSLIGVANSSGFLGKDVDALAAGMEAVLLSDSMSRKDPQIPALLWNRSAFQSNKKLKIGYFEEDEYFPVTHGCKRAIRVAKSALERRGHQVIPFRPPAMEEIFDFGFDILLSEGGGAMLEHWKQEIIDESVKINKTIISAPAFVKTLTKWYLNIWSPRMSKLASQNCSKSYELWNAVQRQKAYADELFSSWREAGIDVLLGPAFPLPAPHPSQHGNLMAACVYYGFYNLLDLPAGTIPVTIENSEDQRKLEEYPSDDYIFQLIKETSRGAEGLPLSVQIGGLPWQEETVLYAMKEIQLGQK